MTCDGAQRVLKGSRFTACLMFVRENTVNGNLFVKNDPVL